MFESLTDKLTGIFQRLSSKGRLTEKDVDEALSLVRRSLLEADVNFRVARDFVARIRERALGADVMQSLTPGQQVVKIVHEELTAVLSGGDHKLTPGSRPPTVLMLVGLQGSGKTTTAAKLALALRRQGHRSLLVAADLRRPAAIQQLETLGRQLDIPVFSQDPKTTTPVKVAQAGLRHGEQLGVQWVIVDTGGRLHIDDELMQELEAIKGAVSPKEIVLVVDAMTGQDAVRAAGDFHLRLGLTGLILTKMDGDSRGGAALSVRSVTGVPVRFMGTGEKPDAFEPFHPDRLAQRILGMGDVLTLIERAQANIDQQKAEQWEKKLRSASFTLEDFLDQLQQVKKMGPLSQLLEMIPGMSSVAKKLPNAALDDRQLKKVEAIIYSMTPAERRRPDILDGSRRRRIAKGSGTTPTDVNQLLNQFTQMQKMLKQYGGMLAGKSGARRLPTGPFRF